MSKILLVDDDEALGRDVRDWFAANSLHLEVALTGEDALQLLSSFEYDLILLDWNLPGISGLDVCKHFRKGGGRSYIVFLTGQGDIDSKEAALDAGGDDYVTKPFDIREVLARIRSVMRRSLSITPEVFELNGVQFDPEKRQLTFNQQTVRLTAKESALLQYLMRHPNRPFNASKLLSAVWPSESEASTDTVRTWMHHLRAKLSGMGKEDFIKTVAGAGYVIESETSQ